MTPKESTSSQGLSSYRLQKAVRWETLGTRLRRSLETQQSAVIVDLCLNKTRSGKSRDYRDVIALGKPQDCEQSQSLISSKTVRKTQNKRGRVTACDRDGDATSSVAEWSACRIRNPAVPGWSPALTTTWICFSVAPSSNRRPRL